MFCRPTFCPASTRDISPLSILPFFWARLHTYGTCIVVGFVLTGCAAQIAYHNGKGLIEDGKVEEGLVKFQQAMAHDPRNAEYKAAYLRVRDQTTANFIAQAERDSLNGKARTAEALYRRVLVIDPDNDRATAGLSKLATNVRHEQALKDAQAALAKSDFAASGLKISNVLTENPNNTQARALQRSMADQVVKPATESTLSAAYKKQISIEFKDVALKQIFEVISRTSGLNFLFDKDVKTDQKSSIFLKNSNIESAVHFTLLTNQLEQQVLNANTILIYPNTAAKLKDYQEMVVKTFFLANAEAKTVANTLKTIVKSRDVVIDEKLNMLIVRDSPEAIKLAEKLIALQDVAEPEVMLEVEILEIKRSRLQELGIQWPDSLTLTPLPGVTGGTLTLRDLRTNINSNTVGAAIGSATVNAKKQDSDTKLLANPRIRARNHEKAKVMIGERVPNITTTATGTYVSESISYIDVGLTLNVEPTVYLDNDVAIKVSLEVSNIVSQFQTKSGSSAYTIGTRSANTVLRLRDGENQVLAGLINDEDRRSASKVPLFGEVPLLGRLFGSTSDDNEKNEIVLSITPHIVRNILRPDVAQAEFSSGTDSSFRTRPDGVSATSPVLTAASSTGATILSNSAASPNVATPTTANPNQNGVPGTGNGNNLGTNMGNTGTGAVPNNVVDAGNTNLQNNGSQPGVQLTWQGPDQIKLGEVLALQLTMQSDTPVTGLPLTIGFDNKVLQIVSVTDGGFLKQGGAQSSFTSRIDPNGQILITGTRTGDGGATAPGTVAIINFRTLMPSDATRIQLLSVAPVGMAAHPFAVLLPTPYVVKVHP